SNPSSATKQNQALRLLRGPFSCRVMLQITTIDFKRFSATLGYSTRHGCNMAKTPILEYRDELKRMVEVTKQRIELMETGVLQASESTVERPEWTNITDRVIARDRDQVEDLEKLIAEITATYGD
ncbi:hypothetical protein, partial [Sinorhizobium fredii]|uniref:hypothetical protein n=1 Tax=Rhizobium fredii TaxID=380 RepID=UPI001AEBD076